MNFFERVPPADFPDKVLGEQERNFTDPPVPFSEKEYFKTGNFHARAGEPTPGVSAKPAPPSKKTSLFSGKGIIICAMLSLATGIAVGASGRGHIQQLPLPFSISSQIRRRDSPRYRLRQRLRL